MASRRSFATSTNENSIARVRTRWSATGEGEKRGCRVARMEKLETDSTEIGEWIRAHEAICSLAKQRAALDHSEGKVLLRAVRARVHEQLGYGTFAEYV